LQEEEEKEEDRRTTTTNGWSTELMNWELGIFKRVLEGRADNGDDDTDQTQHTCSPVRVKNSRSSKP
jgi:hypothetical protein